MPIFVAKTQNVALFDTHFDEFIIPSLEDFVEGDVEEMLLCSVRAIKLCLKRIDIILSAVTVISSQLGRKMSDRIFIFGSGLS